MKVSGICQPDILQFARPEAPCLFPVPDCVIFIFGDPNAVVEICGEKRFFDAVERRWWMKTSLSRCSFNDDQTPRSSAPRTRCSNYHSTPHSHCYSSSATPATPSSTSCPRRRVPHATRRGPSRVRLGSPSLRRRRTWGDRTRGGCCLRRLGRSMSWRRDAGCRMCCWLSWRAGGTSCWMRRLCTCCLRRHGRSARSGLGGRWGGVR
jgi:hypothetical protein